MNHFISISDTPVDQLHHVLDVAAKLKAQLKRTGKNDPILLGKTLAMVFEKPSLRTRVSFAVGMTQLGGSGLLLRDEEVGLGKREPVQDVARVLSSMCDGIMARTFSHDAVVDLAKWSAVPVINGLTDYSHPCQALADILTLQEHFGDLRGRTVAYIGDGNNVTRSLASACGAWGMNFIVSAPPGYELSDADMKRISSQFPKMSFQQIADPNAAVKNADALYTDTWVSMGQEAEKAKRIAAFKGYCIDDNLLAAAPEHAVVLHCLPAYRGLEISDTIIESPRSLIFQEAENRLHAQKGLLAGLDGRLLIVRAVALLLADAPALNDKQLIIGLASILTMGICAQWLAWRIRLPAILLLLAAGLAIGPIWQLNAGHKLLDPQAIFGSLLPPLISLSVAIVLFEGGLTLNLSELRQSGQVLWRLVSFGMLCNGLVIALAAHFLLPLPWPLAVLLAAILVVTGPTVISPMLRFIRPTGQIGSILKWEGIVIDPLGATLALLVFEAVAAKHAPGSRAVAQLVAVNLLRTIGVGGGIGCGAAAVLVLLLRRFWIADQLQVPATLMFVVVSFVAANLLQDEAGLLAVTAMGVALANQRFVPIGHILEFKENLTILLIGSLFILLGSRLNASEITAIGWRAVLFVAALILIARPLSAWVSTVGTSLPWRQRILLAWMAPRGIVAASVASVFSIRLLGRNGSADAVSQLVPITFAVVVVTVTTYGLSSAWLARRLSLSRPGHGGILIVGANPVARAVATALKDAEQEVLLVDTNRAHVSAARLSGLPAFQGNALSEELLGRIEGSSIGRMLALTPNIDANALAMLHFSRHFGRSQVYALPHGTPEKSSTGRGKLDMSHELLGRRLFDSSLAFEEFWDRLDGAATIRKTQLTREFDFIAMTSHYPEPPIVLFVINELGELIVRTTADHEPPRPGQTVIALVVPPRTRGG